MESTFCHGNFISTVVLYEKSRTLLFSIVDTANWNIVFNSAKPVHLILNHTGHLYSELPGNDRNARPNSSSFQLMPNAVVFASMRPEIKIKKCCQHFHMCFHAVTVFILQWSLFSFLIVQLRISQYICSRQWFTSTWIDFDPVRWRMCLSPCINMLRQLKLRET